jgi:hypothetical protein
LIAEGNPLGDVSNEFIDCYVNHVNLEPLFKILPIVGNRADEVGELGTRNLKAR